MTPLDSSPARARLPFPSLGFGGGSAFVGGAGEVESLELLFHAWARGLRYYDTAPFYGTGLSEHRFGAALRHYPRDDFVLSTKVGRMLMPNPGAKRATGKLPFDVVCDYGYGAVMRSIEDSLQRLGLARIDVALVHDLSPHWHGDAYAQRLRDAVDGGFRALVELREAGVVRAIGAGMRDVDALLSLARSADLDCVMLAGGYTLLDQGSLPALLPFCSERGIDVLLASPFNSGILATGAASGASYFYAPASAEIVERTRRIEAVCARHGVPLGAAALQFPRTHPAIVSVVAGYRSKDELDTNLRWNGWPIPPDFWAELRDAGLIDRETPLAAHA